ncbi:hypothetical protein GCM10020255_020890 [Rhodococcus baikonurensis]
MGRRRIGPAGNYRRGLRNAPLGERRLRDKLEDSLDTSIHTRWPDVRLLFDWKFEGGSTQLAIMSVDHNDVRAKQKSVEKKLRNVVESKFGKASTPVDCDIIEWQEGLSPTGEALLSERE